MRTIAGMIAGLLVCGGCYESSAIPIGSCEARVRDLAEEMLRPSDWSCTAVIRLDYRTLEIVGYRLFCGEARRVSEEEARERADEDVELNHEYGDFLTARMLNEPDPDDAYVFYRDAGDFGGVAVVSPYTGMTLFGGSTIWSGFGQIAYPRSWRDPSGLGPGCGSGGTPAGVTVYPWPEVVEEGEVEAVLEVVRETALIDAMQEAGELLGAVVLFYAETVGVFDPSSASWIVFLNAGG